MGKSFCFKLKTVLGTNNFEESEALLLILALGLMELYIDYALFLSSMVNQKLK